MEMSKMVTKWTDCNSAL